MQIIASSMLMVRYPVIVFTLGFTAMALGIFAIQLFCQHNKCLLSICVSLEFNFLRFYLEQQNINIIFYFSKKFDIYLFANTDLFLIVNQNKSNTVNIFMLCWRLMTISVVEYHQVQVSSSASFRFCAKLLYYTTAAMTSS